MDIKVNNVSNPAPVDNAVQLQPGTDAFKFALISNIEEQDLQARLSGLMQEITRQGDSLSKKKDIKDMKRYRGLVKDFMNEILNRSHKFSRENFLDGKDATGFTVSYVLLIRIWMSLRRSC